mgnify:CR=1 FL=1
MLLPLLFRLFSAQSQFLLVTLEVLCASVAGGSTADVLRRARRRSQRREAASRHYARSLEDFPELSEWRRSP